MGRRPGLGGGGGGGLADAVRRQADRQPSLAAIADEGGTERGGRGERLPGAGEQEGVLMRSVEGLD